jgi:cytosine/adenosine deaminase-related metal-dependent hydrolase
MAARRLSAGRSTVKRRDVLKLGGAALAASAAATFAAVPAGIAQTPAPRGSRILIRGGYVVTLDPQLGELRGLIDGGRIAAVGKNLEAGSAEVVDAADLIVLPGLIDSHRHLWQSALRFIGADWTLRGYFGTMFYKFGVNFRPEDVYAGNLVGRVAALDGGITTLLDWSHIMNSPAHADAAVAAHRDAGGRSMFAMGWPQAPDPSKWLPPRSSADLPDDIRRVRQAHFASNSGLVTLAMAARGPEFAVMEQVGKDLKTARDLGLRTTMHVVGGGSLVALDKAGLMGPDIDYVHLMKVTDQEAKLIKDSGGSASISPTMELKGTPWRGEPPAAARLLRNDVVPSLSADSESGSPGDMFSMVRVALLTGRYAASNPAESVAPPSDPAQWNAASVIPLRRALEMATIAGARSLGLEREIGSLTPGKAADVLLLDARRLNHFPLNDAIGAVVMAADTGSIDAVFVAGKPVKFGGRLLDQAMVERARRLASESRDWLFAKAGLALPDGLAGRPG